VCCEQNLDAQHSVVQDHHKSVAKDADASKLMEIAGSRASRMKSVAHNKEFSFRGGIDIDGDYMQSTTVKPMPENMTKSAKDRWLSSLSSVNSLLKDNVKKSGESSKLMNQSIKGSQKHSAKVNMSGKVVPLSGAEGGNSNSAPVGSLKKEKSSRYAADVMNFSDAESFAALGGGGADTKDNTRESKDHSSSHRSNNAGPSGSNNATGNSTKDGASGKNNNASSGGSSSSSKTPSASTKATNNGFLALTLDAVGEIDEMNPLDAWQRANNMQRSKAASSKTQTFSNKG
jgi:hypothetical protein